MPIPSISKVTDAMVLATSNVTSVTYSSSRPFRLLRTLYVSLAASDATAVLTINHTTSLGTALSPTGAAAGGTMTLNAGNTVASSVVYKEDETPGGLIVYPGEALQVSSDGGGTAGSGSVFFEIEELSFTDAAQRRAGTPGTTTNPTPLANAVKVTS